MLAVRILAVNGQRLLHGLNELMMSDCFSGVIGGQKRSHKKKKDKTMKKKVAFLLVVTVLLTGCGDLGYTGLYWDRNSCLCWNEGVETRQEAWKTRKWEA